VIKSRKFRNLAFLLHRYLGLMAGFLLVFIGLTGSLLVFKPEIEQFIITQQVGSITPEVVDSRKQPLGESVIAAFEVLHYGTFGGVFTRIVYIFVGLAPLVLFATSFVMWWYRKK
jgi:uncharacterized iron-regulated membrane protein